MSSKEWQAGYRRLFELTRGAWDDATQQEYHCLVAEMNSKAKIHQSKDFEKRFTPAEQDEIERFGKALYLNVIGAP